MNAPANLFVIENGLPTKDEARAAISRLRADHNFFMDELSRAIKTLRRLLSMSEKDGLADGMRDVQNRVLSVSQRLIEHNELEESAVYEWPSRLLRPADLAQLSDVVRHEVQNVPPRFAGAL